MSPLAVFAAAALAATLAGCHGRGGAETPASSATSQHPPAAVNDAPPAPTTTAPTTATSSPADGPVELGPAAGDVLAVIGVAHDDVLHLRAQPGADHVSVARIPPLADTLVARGRTRHLERSFWTQVAHDGTEGWVHLGFVGYIGDTSDETAAVVSALGERPVSDTLRELGRLAAEQLASNEPQSKIVLTVAPTTGDLGEVTYDVVGLGDESVRGLRVHVFGAPPGFMLS